MFESETIKSIFDYLAKFMDSNSQKQRRQRQIFYKNLLVPSYARLEKVHSDYIRNISALRRILSQQEWPSSENTQWLAEAMCEQMIERDLLKQFSRNLENFEFYFVKFGTSKGKNLAIYRAFIDFSRSIMSYFRYGDIGDPSWYSELSDMLNAISERYENYFRKMQTQGRLPPNTSQKDFMSFLSGASACPTDIDDKKLVLPRGLRSELERDGRKNLKKCDDALIHLRTHFAEAAAAYAQLTALCTDE